MSTNNCKYWKTWNRISDWRHQILLIYLHLLRSAIWGPFNHRCWPQTGQHGAKTNGGRNGNAPRGLNSPVPRHDGNRPKRNHEFNVEWRTNKRGRLYTYTFPTLTTIKTLIFSPRTGSPHLWAWGYWYSHQPEMEYQQFSQEAFGPQNNFTL